MEKYGEADCQPLDGILRYVNECDDEGFESDESEAFGSEEDDIDAC